MTGRLLETEGLVQTLVTRKRLKLLAHLPLTGVSKLVYQSGAPCCDVCPGGRIAHGQMRQVRAPVRVTIENPGSQVKR